jgi:hypothetical protein
MSWKQPQSEQEWQECLSAYLDGEMTEAEKRGFSEYLKKNPARNEELRQLEELRDTLGEWKIDHPDAERAFDKITAQLDESSSVHDKIPTRGNFNILFQRWVLRAAIFTVGVLTGILIMSKSHQENPMNVEYPTTRVQSAFPRQSAHVHDMGLSSEQVDSLMREVAAETLITQIREDIRKRHFNDATRALEQLYARYSTTHAVKEFEKDSIIESYRTYKQVAERR